MTVDPDDYYWTGTYSDGTNTKTIDGTLSANSRVVYTSIVPKLAGTATITATDWVPYPNP